MVQQQSASVEILKASADAFNAHDLDAIMEFFADDCSLDMPCGREPWGQRFTGKATVREGLATRFKGLPDVHYGGDWEGLLLEDSRGGGLNFGIREYVSPAMQDVGRLNVAGFFCCSIVEPDQVGSTFSPRH